MCPPQAAENFKHLNKIILETYSYLFIQEPRVGTYILYDLLHGTISECSPESRHRITPRHQKQAKQQSAQLLLKLWQKATLEFATFHSPPQLPVAARVERCSPQPVKAMAHGRMAHVSSTEQCSTCRAPRARRRGRGGRRQARRWRAPCSSRREE